MTTIDTRSIHQKNVEAWLTLTDTLNERRMRYETRINFEGTQLWIECLGLKAYPNCIPMIRIGPEVGNAALEVRAHLLVPASCRAYAERVLAQASLEFTLGTFKFNADSGAILAEKPILFADRELRPKAALYILRRMCQQIEAVIFELWDGLSAGNG